MSNTVVVRTEVSVAEVDTKLTESQWLSLSEDEREKVITSAILESTSGWAHLGNEYLNCCY